MTSVGRGRIWGSNKEMRGVMTTAEMEVDSLIAAVHSINLTDAKESVATLREVEELLKTQCQAEEDLRLVVHCLHDRSLKDRQFGMKAAVVYGSVASLEVAGVKLRNILLLAVQKDFEDRTHLQTACNAKFLNSVALLGEIFHQVHLPDGSPINILASAVLQYEDMLLGGEEHELELFTTQLAVNGRKLYDCRPGELEELMLQVRRTVMSRNLSARCRCWLLLALDLASSRYAPLSGQLQGFYQVHLGANAFLQLQRFQVGLKIDTGSDHTEVDHVPTTQISQSVEKNLYGEDVNEVMVKCKSPDQPYVEKCVFKIKDTARRTGLHDVKPSVGGGRKTGEEHGQARVDGIKSGSSSSGNGNFRGGKKFIPSRDDGGWRKDRGHKRRDTDQNEDIWGNPRGRRADSWCHDDCFQKDYKFYGKQSGRGEGTFRPRNKGRSSGKWKDGKGTEGKDQMITPKSETNETESKPILVAPPPLTEEENWD